MDVPVEQHIEQIVHIPKVPGYQRCSVPGGSWAALTSGINGIAT